jgi:succinyl-CoA synthetase beta subunit
MPLDRGLSSFPGISRGLTSQHGRRRWGDLEFPLPFGRSMTSAEEYVHDLDGKTGASLKLSILNPKGRIWTMVAGGGASVIYADTVGDLGYAEELGNYAEYSGAPNTAVCTPLLYIFAAPSQSTLLLHFPLCIFTAPSQASLQSVLTPM